MALRTPARSASILNQDFLMAKLDKTAYLAQQHVEVFVQLVQIVDVLIN